MTPREAVNRHLETCGTCGLAVDAEGQPIYGSDGWQLRVWCAEGRAIEERRMKAPKEPGPPR